MTPALICYACAVVGFAAGFLSCALLSGNRNATRDPG